MKYYDSYTKDIVGGNEKKMSILTAYCMWDPGYSCEKKNSIYGCVQMYIYIYMYSLIVT